MNTNISYPTQDGWIGVDFDGTTAVSVPHPKPYDPAECGEPITEMVSRIKFWLASGITVKIFTGRVANDPDHIAEKAIKQWCKKHIGEELEVTCIKDADCFQIWDDKAVRIEKNTGCIEHPQNPEIHNKIEVDSTY